MPVPEPVNSLPDAAGQKRSKRYKSALVAVSFGMLLLLPTLDQLLNLSTEFESTEKRILAPMPRFRFPHVKTFIAEFNQYYKENFGW